MRRTPSTPEKARKSADARLKANDAALQQAWRNDVKAGPEHQQKYQWRAATEWLRSEATALSDAQRQQLLEHVIGLCRDMNAQARLTVVPAG
jgi:hypothetical protein